MKRIIFDLDNTLIVWKKEYDERLINYLIDEKAYLKEEIDNILKFFHKYNSTTLYSKIDMLNYIIENTKIDFKMRNLDEMLNICSSCYEKLDITDTLKYLASKYELVVLTNWFTFYQKKRLEQTDILKYFDCVIGSDMVVPKPNKEAFLLAKGNNKVSECIVVGDDYTIDILGALNVGMKAIYLTNKKIKYSNTISNINELRSVL